MATNALLPGFRLLKGFTMQRREFASNVKSGETSYCFNTHSYAIWHQKKTLHTKRDTDRKEIWDIYIHTKKEGMDIDNIIYAPIISSLFDLRFI